MSVRDLNQLVVSSHPGRSGWFAQVYTTDPVVDSIYRNVIRVAIADCDPESGRRHMAGTRGVAIAAERQQGLPQRRSCQPLQTPEQIRVAHRVEPKVIGADRSADDRKCV